MTNNLYPIQIVDIYSFNTWNAADEKAKGTRGVIFKAGQGGYSSIPRNYIYDAEQVGIPWGVYWVIDSRIDSDSHMASIKSTFPDMDFGNLGLWWDLEKPKYDMTDIQYWATPYAGNALIESVMDKFFVWSGITGGVYTSRGFAKMLGWDTAGFLVKSLASKLEKMPLWTAQYNNTVTKPDIFAPFKTWELWQYRPDPDYNYYNGSEAEFIARFNITLPDPPVDGEIKLLEAQVYYPGAIEKTFEVTTPHGNVVFHLTELETAKVKNFFVSPSPASRTYVPTFLKNNFLHFAINCGGWTSPPLVPTGYNSSEGQPYGQFGNEETIYISKNNVFSLARPSELWNAFSFQNRLIKDGVIPVINKAITDVRARTAIGYNQTQTRVYLFTCDGGDQYSTDGLNFQEVAAILLKLGCYQAFILDGGGSTAKVVDDNGIVKVIGKTSGEDFITGYEYPLRRVLNVFGVVMDDGIITPPTGDKMYKVLVSIKDRPIASMYSTGATVRAAGYQFDSTVTVTGTNILKPSDFGVTFVQLPSGSWLPLKYKGVEYVTVTTIVPPDGKVLTNVIKVFNDGSIDVVPA